MLICLQVKEDIVNVVGNVSSFIVVDKVVNDVLVVFKIEQFGVVMISYSFVILVVGDEVKSDGLIVVIFVIIGIGLYLWICFECCFVIVVLVIEVYDVLVMLGVIVLVQCEFDFIVLVLVLVVIGYLINDKVVVFDCICELFCFVCKVELEEIFNCLINIMLL